MKKILFYTDTPLLGGAENQMLLLAKFLPRDRFKVTLACSDKKTLNCWCQDFMEIGMNVIRLKVFHKHDPRHFLYLKKILPDFDLLHLHIWNPASCRYAFLAANKTPICVTEHDPFPIKGFKGWLKNKLFKKVKKIIVASKAAKELVIEQNPDFGELIEIIPNGIDIEEWRLESKLADRAEKRMQNFGAKQNEKVILSVAELHERKGQKYLIEAMRKISAKIPNVKLVFAGDGKMRKNYEKLCKPFGDKVLFLGRQREIGKLMAAADVFVLPSVREAFGLVVLEASTSEIPVVASDIGGISEIVENGKTGILVEPKNPDQLAVAIEKILTNPEIALEFVKNAKERTETYFNAKTMAEKTAGVYEKILKP